MFSPSACFSFRVPSAGKYFLYFKTFFLPGPLWDFVSKAALGYPGGDPRGSEHLVALFTGRIKLQELASERIAHFTVPSASQHSQGLAPISYDAFIHNGC